MSLPPPVAQSFQEIFCAQYGVPADLYGDTVLRITLYPHARWLANLSPQEFLAVDRRFITGVGRLTRWSGFADTASDFQHSPENGRFWRRTLCLRVSVARMRALFSEVMGEGRSTAASESWALDEAQGGSGLAAE